MSSFDTAHIDLAADLIKPADEWVVRDKQRSGKIHVLKSTEARREARRGAHGEDRPHHTADHEVNPCRLTQNDDLGGFDEPAFH